MLIKAGDRGEDVVTIGLDADGRVRSSGGIADWDHFAVIRIMI